MQAKFAAIIGFAALGAHHKRFAAAVAKLVLALGAREMHTAAAWQRIAEFAFRTIDAVHLQMLADTFRLRFGIVGGFPFGELIARDALVLFLPLFFVGVLKQNIKK